MARASVVKPGTTITVCRSEVFHFDNGAARLTAAMLTTLVNVPA